MYSEYSIVKYDTHINIKHKTLEHVYSKTIGASKKTQSDGEKQSNI